MGRCAKQKRRAFALVVAMIFVCIFGTLLACFSNMANVNAQISHNERKINCALGSAQSGLDVVRFLFTDLTISSAVTPGERLSAVAVRLQENLAVAGMSNIIATYDGSTITIQDVTLDSQSNQAFNAVVRQIDDDTLQLDVSGCRGQITRTIRANFDFASTTSPVFDFGLATRGPLAMSGNAKLQGLNFDAEANVYIESTDNSQALTMGGNSKIAGEVSIGNPDAYVNLTGNPTISGESGQEAIDNHVYIGVKMLEFPLPEVTSFEQYVQNIVDTDTITIGDLAFQNVRIVAGTNPSFSGNIQFDGIILIESPNIVSFSGNITITGLIVADGDAEFPYSTDSLSFTGNLHTYDCSYLPEGGDFDGLKTLTGSFLLAPGFSIDFGGNFSTVGGVIAGNGITFSGNAGGMINGTVLNYSQDMMTLSGNSTIYFSLPETEESPAGFTGQKELIFNSASYTEIIL